MISACVTGALATVITLGNAAGLVGAGVVALGAGLGISSAATKFGAALHEKLHDNGFITLKPGERHRFGKMSLSLW